MATIRTFDPLAAAQLDLAQRRQATGGDPLSALIQGFQLPQQLASQALNEQLSRAIQQAKLQELSQGKIMEVGGRLVKVNPQTGEVEVVLQSTPNANQQFVGFANGKPIVFDPRNASFSTGSLPAGVDFTGGIAPKVTPLETFSTENTDQGLTRVGNRSTQGVPFTLPTGGQAQAPTKTSPVQDIQYTDAIGNLFVRKKGSSIDEPVLDSSGAQRNLGVANQIFSSDQGIFTAPKKTEGGAAPTAPTPLTGPTGTPLTRTPASKGAAASEAGNEFLRETAQRNLESVSDLKTRVGNDTVGVGGLTSSIPGTPAADFKADLDTLKANIAFGALQQMRNASKTGGALGQVSDREGKLLQSTLGALDTNQSPANFSKNLDKIEASIKRFQEAQDKQGVKAPGTPVNIKTKAEFDKLPSGSQYIGPSGNLATKP